MTQAKAAARVFIAAMEHGLYISWWTSIRMADCGEKVYLHGVSECKCGRGQLDAFAAWKIQNPGIAAQRESRSK